MSRGKSTAVRRATPGFICNRDRSNRVLVTRWPCLRPQSASSRLQDLTSALVHLVGLSPMALHSTSFHAVSLTSCLPSHRVIEPTRRNKRDSASRFNVSSTCLTLLPFWIFGFPAAPQPAGSEATGHAQGVTSEPLRRQATSSAWGVHRMRYEEALICMSPSGPRSLHHHSLSQRHG